MRRCFIWEGVYHTAVRSRKTPLMCGNLGVFMLDVTTVRSSICFDEGVDFAHVPPPPALPPTTLGNSGVVGVVAGQEQGVERMGMGE